MDGWKVTVHLLYFKYQVAFIFPPKQCPGDPGLDIWSTELSASMPKSGEAILIRSISPGRYVDLTLWSWGGMQCQGPSLDICKCKTYPTNPESLHFKYTTLHMLDYYIYSLRKRGYFVCRKKQKRFIKSLAYFPYSILLKNDWIKDNPSQSKIQWFNVLEDNHNSLLWLFCFDNKEHTQTSCHMLMKGLLDMST